MNKLLPPPKSGTFSKAFMALLVVLCSLFGTLRTHAQTASSTATVYTDKPDYLPNDVVIIQGDGWEANELVTLVIDHSTVTHGNTVLTATADINGHIRNEEFVIQPIHLGESFTLDATGQSSGLTAHTTFTDGNSFTAAVSPTSACVGATITYNLTIKNTGFGNNPASIASAKITAPSGYTIISASSNWTPTTSVTISAISLTTSTPTGTSTGTPISAGNSQEITIKATAPATSSTPNWNVTAYSDANYTTAISTSNSGPQSTIVSLPVTVNKLPSAPSVSSPIYYCQGDAASALTANGTNLLWYSTSSGGTGSATAPTPSTTGSGTVSYYVSQTTTDCEGPRTKIDVVVSPPPTAPTPPANAQSVCTDGTTTQTLTATASAPSGSSVVWYAASTGGTALSTAPTQVGVGSTTYYAASKLTTSPYCESTTRTPITLTIKALPSVSITGTPSFCTGSSTTLTASVPANSGTISSYQWYRDGVAISNGNSSNGKLATYDASMAGIYTVQVTSNDCPATSAAVAVTANALPATPTISTTTPTTFCQGGSVVLTSSAATGNQWYVGGNAIPSATGPAYTATATGSYTVQVTNSSGCLSAISAAKNVTVDAPPTTANAGNTQNVAGTTTTLAATPASVGTGTWTITTGTNGTIATPNSPTSAFSGTAGSSYTLRWTVVNGTCSSFSEVVINFVQRPTTLSVSPATAAYGATATLSATLTLTSGGTGISGKSLAFALNGTNVGTATTNANGLATLTGVSLSGLNASTTAYTVAVSFPAEPSYAASSGTSGLTITKASQTISLTTAPPASTAFGTSFVVVAATASSGLPVTFTSTLPLTNAANSYTMTSGIGTGAVQISQAGNGNYEAAPPRTFNVAAIKADATINVAGYTGPYNGQAHGATGTATGVGNANLTNQLSLGTSFTNYPGGTANWSFAGGNDYNSTSGTVDITINQAPLTIKAKDQQKNYGQTLTLVGTEFDATGLVNNEAAGPATLSSAGLASTAQVQAYDITPSAVVASGTFKPGNYSVTYQKGTLTVAPVTPSLRLTVGGPYTYDGNGHPATATLTGVNNDALTATLTYKNSANTPVTVPTEAGTYTVTASFAGTTNYNAVVPDVTGTLIINQAPATITLGNLTPTYTGGPLAATVTVGSANLSDVTVTYTGQAPTSYTTKTAPPTAAGSYTVTATLTNANYKLVDSQGNTIPSVTGTLTISKAPATVAFNAATLSASYNGQAHAVAAQVTGATGQSSFTYTYDGSSSVPTDYKAGGYAVKAVLLNDNYAGEATGILTISKVTLTVMTNPQSKPYGSTFDATHYSGSLSGNAASDNLSIASYASAGAVATATVAGGPYSITATLSDPANRLFNYNVSNSYGSLTITPAELTVVNDNQTKEYGQLFSAFTGSITGLQNGDNITVTRSSTGAAATATAAQTYPIVGTLVDPTSKLGNYTLSNPTGTLTITKAVLTVTADNLSKVYGVDNPTLTASYSGFKNSQDLSTSGVTGAPALGTLATATSPVGPYTITVGTGTLTSANYSFAPVNGTLTIGKATASVVVATASKVYGTSDPTFGGTVSGLVAADGITVTYGRTAGESVGSYVISATLSPAAALSNYNLTNTPANLTITKAALLVTADDKSKSYGADLPGLTATYTGLVNGDKAPATVPTLSTTATAASPVVAAGYPISASGAADANYTITYKAGTLTINPVALTITADDKSKNYGAALPAFTTTYAGFVNSDDATKLGGTLGFTTSATAASPVGSYDVTPKGLTSNNYTISYKAGSLTINPVALLVTADDKSKSYGADLPTFTATYTGLVNGDKAPATAPTLSTTATSASPVVAAGYPITANGAADANYTITYKAGTLTIKPVALLVTAENKSKDYGAALPTFTATYTGLVNGDKAPATLPTLSTKATAASVVGTYPITASDAADANYTITYKAGTLTINKKADVSATYTGALFSSTSGTNVSTAVVTLSATIKDLALDGGDIRNATVSFVTRNADNTVTLINKTPLAVGLVTATDVTTGTVTFNWPVDIGNADSQNYTIGIIVDGSYTHNASVDNQVVTVSKPLNDFITGGGYLMLTKSSGLYAGDINPSSRNNFGFNVKYNKSGTNLQGNINAIVRRTDPTDGKLHVYQVKGNSMTSMAVNAAISAAHPYPTAVFNGKASIQDITDPNLTVSVDGGATLQVTMTDQGDPGSKDQIAITVWNKAGGLWYASNWDGTKTVEQQLAGGNLKVSTNSSFSTTTATTAALTSTVVAAATATPEKEATDKPKATSNLLEVFPAPMVSAGTIHFHTTEGGKAQVYVYDQVGRLVTTLYNAEVESSQEYYLPLSAENLAEGVYSCRLIVNGKVENKRFSIQH